LSGECTVRVRFHQPSPALRCYFTSFYLTEIEVADGGRVEDFLHPEWGGVRMIRGDLPDGEPLGGAPYSGIANIGMGPTCTTVRFCIGTSRIWGLGLLPAGWAKFIGEPASQLADAVHDVDAHASFAHLRPLSGAVIAGAPDEAAELARIDAFFMSHIGRASPDEERIIAVHAALLDEDVGNVHEMVDASGVKPHTLERLCRRYFGFAPSLLLRRQRFMRSLVHYMLDPSLKWIGAIDAHYHDQAQFVRDFHRFMGMSPREYAAQPHPILDAVMHARAIAAGAAVQALHPPGGRA
jgi:AraC-like DNA-binding protein